MMDLPSVSLFAAFLAGIISFLSPCVLPLVPGYVSYIVGRTPEQLQGQRGGREMVSALVVSLFFILGFTVVFIVLGASASAIGRLFAAYRYEANIVGGILLIIMGIAMITGYLSMFGIWLLNTFPFLLNIG